jgi:hypothetical protein
MVNYNGWRRRTLGNHIEFSASDFKLVSSEECPKDKLFFILNGKCVGMIKNIWNREYLGEWNESQMASFVPPKKPAVPMLPVTPHKGYNYTLPSIKKTDFLEDLQKYPSTTTPGYNGIFNIDDTKPIKKPKAIDEYPHKCNKCGHKCYMGLNEIKHENPKHDIECH